MCFCCLHHGAVQLYTGEEMAPFSSDIESKREKIAATMKNGVDDASTTSLQVQQKGNAIYRSNNSMPATTKCVQEKHGLRKRQNWSTNRQEQFTCSIYFIESEGQKRDCFKEKPERENLHSLFLSCSNLSTLRTRGRSPYGFQSIVRVLRGQERHGISLSHTLLVLVQLTEFHA